MRLYEDYLYDSKAYQKTVISDIKSILLFAILGYASFILLRQSLRLEGWWQDLFLGLGTGALTSALVSLVFYVNEKQIKIRERIYQRDAFMHKFRFLYHGIINSINFDSNSSTMLKFEAYVKNQHRWFHEYYKRMIANSDTHEETMLRIKYIKKFISLIIARFNQTFEYDTDWMKGDYTRWQRTELLEFYAEFKNIQINLQHKCYRDAIVEFAYFLERIKRMSTEFDELKNFDLLKFGYDKQGELYIDRTLFEEKESIFKHVRKFHEIRISNYKKYYKE